LKNSKRAQALRGRPPKELWDHQGERQPGNTGLPAERSSNSDRCAVELGERKAVERLVINVPLIAQNTDGEGLTEQK
jgi:hypothetical protein